MSIHTDTEEVRGRAARGRTARGILGWGAPVAGLVVLIVVVLVWQPLRGFRTAVPIEEITVERTIFEPGSVEIRLRNAGEAEVSIAQVLVNEAYWAHEIEKRELGRLEATTLRIPYPWEPGVPVHIALVTSTGATVEHEIEAASLTPLPGLRTFWTYTVIGGLVGVVPVSLGLLWLGPLRRAGRRTMHFLLGLTIGLLAFLFVDTAAAGIDISGEVAASLDGVGLFAIGGFGAVALLTAFERGFGARQRTNGPGGYSPLGLAYLVATGVGLHNLGEGLGIGTAVAVGDVALGTSLIVGFMVHNTTEGIAIAAPLGDQTKSPGAAHLVLLAVVAGVPTIPGTWAGGFAFSPVWATLALGAAAGAIAQVIWVVLRSLPLREDVSAAASAAGILAGLGVMYATGLLTV